MAASTPLQFERHGATALLRMVNPARRNALELDMREALAAAIETVRTDHTIRAMVLTGSGGSFCAGGDVKAMTARLDGDRNVFEGRSRILEMHRWIEQLVDLEKPVIAAVDGAAFGGGLSLTLAADYVLASPSATFCAVFARIGFVPDLASMYLLPRHIGLRAAKDLAFTARVVAADEALTLGLVQRIVEQDLEAEALALAARFEGAPTEAIGMAKRIMNNAFESERSTVLQQEAMAQAICRESAFHHDAVRRFVAKQPPAYTWE